MYTEEHIINEATYSILAIKSPCTKFNLTDWKIKDTFARKESAFHRKFIKINSSKTGHLEQHFIHSPCMVGEILDQ